MWTLLGLDAKGNVVAKAVKDGPVWHCRLWWGRNCIGYVHTAHNVVEAYLWLKAHGAARVCKVSEDITLLGVVIA